MSSLFIGLGGAGTGVLDYLSIKLNIYNEDMARQGHPQVSAHYYYIDTDNTRLFQHPEEFMPGSHKTFHLIGRHSPEQIVKAFQNVDRESYEFLIKWYDAPPKASDMNHGADVVRQYARLAFSIESTIIRNDLYPLIQQVAANQGRIYVVTSSCGGTGSGIYMDLLYMISEIYANIHTSTSSADVRLIMVMPDGYLEGRFPDDIGNWKMRLNAFATLEELNAICKDIISCPSKFNGCYVSPAKKKGSFQPFHFGYLYDSAEQSRDTICQNLSEFLFELELAGTGDSNHCAAGIAPYNGSFFDMCLTNNVNANWNASLNNNYVQAFNALGRYTIEKPDFLYIEYFTNRLIYDVFHQGLIGSAELVDDGLVLQLAQSFTRECADEIINVMETLINSLSVVDFDGDYRAANIFSVFTNYPDTHNDIVRQIIDCKDILLKRIKAKVYEQCKEWMARYDLTTVYTILERLDVYAYAAAVNTFESFEWQLENAKQASLGGFFRKKINPNKAFREFKSLLNTWLTFEVNKALSSGVGVDISVQNRGYLDRCKDSIGLAKHRLSLKNDQEHWDVHFKKKVAFLKHADNRSFIPSLDTIVDNNCNIPADSPIVAIYKNIVLANPSQADFAHGTCTMPIFHERIIEAMKADASDEFTLDDFFDLTPTNSKSLHAPSMAMLFMGKYIAEAKKQIKRLLDANVSYQQLFSGDILTRLQNLPMQERARICLDFANYDRVQLRTEYMNENALTSYTYYVISSTANTSLMQDLGILDANGAKPMNSDYSSSNPFFEDKIAKLIVKNGYTVNDYRYFAGYKKFAQDMLTKDLHYDPFIDKRFLGELDADGKYSCDVSATLNKIAQAERDIQ